jgi:hypothetical protein
MELFNYYWRRHDLDEETRQKILVQLEEIDAMRQEQKQKQKQKQQQRTLVAPIKYLKFVHDKERKVLSFTGKFDKVEVKAIDFETFEAITHKYIYSLYCHDANDIDPYNLLIWQCDMTEAETVLSYLSKNETILEVTCNGRPGSKTTTYQINPPLD